MRSLRYWRFADPLFDRMPEPIKWMDGLDDTRVDHRPRHAVDNRRAFILGEDLHALRVQGTRAPDVPSLPMPVMIVTRHLPGQFSATE